MPYQCPGTARFRSGSLRPGTFTETTALDSPHQSTTARPTSCGVSRTMSTHAFSPCHIHSHCVASGGSWLSSVGLAARQAPAVSLRVPAVDTFRAEASRPRPATARSPRRPHHSACPEPRSIRVKRRPHIVNHHHFGCCIQQHLGYLQLGKGTPPGKAAPQLADAQRFRH